MKPRNVLVLTYWSYAEALIQTYTLPYVRIMLGTLPAGSKVFLVTLEKKELKMDDRTRDRIKSELKPLGIYWISFTYFNFGFKAGLNWLVIFLRLLILLAKENYSVIHCWCTPAGAAGYFLSLVTGRTLILDSYEPHAETMVENDTWRKNSLAFRLLFWLEKLQSGRASFTISCTEGMRVYARQKYGIELKNFFVKPACVDLSLFSGDKRKNPDLIARFGLKDKIVCVYAGKFGGIYLEHEVFDFLKVAFDHWGSAFRVMLLSNHTREAIDSYCRRANLPSEIVLLAFVKHQDVPEYLGLADFAITPVKPIPTKRYCSPIKDGEYWASGLPIVIPEGISDDSEIVRENNIGAILHSLDFEAYQSAVNKIDELLHQPSGENFNRIRLISEKYRSFRIAEKVYKEIYTT